MKRLRHPQAQYRRDLSGALTASELHHYITIVDNACGLAADYRRLSPRLHTMHTKISDSNTRRFFIELYDRKRKSILKLKGRVRRLNKATAALCQYCGLPAPKSLDHFLQKAEIPELSLFTPNLIPCCRDCNNSRGPAFEADGTRRILHFYDDQVDNMPDVLRARVTLNSNGIPAARYWVTTSNDELVKVYRRHFKALDLAFRYRDQTSVHLGEIRENIRLRISIITHRELVAELHRTAESLTQVHGRNYYRAALCRALASSPAALKWLLT